MFLAIAHTNVCMVSIFGNGHMIRGLAAVATITTITSLALLL
jgi:hypothetical protein